MSVERKRSGGRGRGQTATERETVVATFERAWALLGGPALVKELQFAPPRLFRFDYSHLPGKVAIECEGGVFVKGWHQSPERYVRDCTKYNLAQLHGWQVYRLTIDMVRDDPVGHLGPIIALIKERAARSQLGGGEPMT